MGCLISIEQEIETIRFVDFPNRPKSVEKVVRIDNLIMARINSTTAATNRVNKNFAYLPDSSRMDDVVRGLFLLGMISESAMESHIAHCKARGDASNRRYAAERMLENAKTLGLPLTKAQMAKIEQATIINKRPAQ